MLLVAVAPLSLVPGADSFSLVSDLLPLRCFVRNSSFSLNSCICTVFPDSAFLPQPLCYHVPPSKDPTLQPQHFCFSQPMLYNTPFTLVPFVSPNWNLLAFPVPPPWRVCPCRARGKPGHCLYQQVHGRNNKWLKEEVESSTHYLLPRTSPVHSLGTPSEQW